MKRVTQRDGTGAALLGEELEERYTEGELIDLLLDHLATYEDSGFEPETFAEMAETMNVLNERFKPFVAADDDGRLVILPCKIGDSIWRIEFNRKGKASLAVYPEYRVREYKVSTIYGGEDKLSIFAGMVLPDGTLTTSYDVFEEDDFGKTLFTSKDDALKEVERRNGENHGDDT